MLSYIPEIFLVSAFLAQLIFNAKLINLFKNNFPIIDKETFYQTVLILIWLLFLTFNLNIETISWSSFFLQDSGCKLIKLIIIIFSIVISYIIFPAIIFQKINFFEFFSLYLCALLSFLLLINSHNLMSLYLIVELQALCFYILAGFIRNSAFSTEAGLKYFIANSFISGFLLLGIFFIYSSLGTLSLSDIVNLLSFNLSSFNLLFKIVIYMGSLLIISALLFKIACAPFHFWAPDVYEGAPIASTVIFSILPKISLIFFFSKFLFSLGLLFLDIKFIFLALGLFSCFIGTIFSLYQKRIKRLVIFSSIAQVGFLVSGLALNSLGGLSAVFFFLIVYSITSMLVWGHIIYFNYVNFKINTFNQTEIEILSLTHFAGFFHKNKAWTFSLILIFFSIAGIPPVSGFISKVLILQELVFSQQIFTAVILIIISSISVVYYLRIIKTISFEHKNVLNINSNFQVNFLDTNTIKLNFLFAFFLFSLVIILFFPTKIYLFCQYIVLKSIF